MFSTRASVLNKPTTWLPHERSSTTRICQSRSCFSAELSGFAHQKVAKYSPSVSICPPDSFPQGFLVSSLHCGIKKSSTTNPAPQDLALVVSDRPASAAGCFTRNVFKAAPVLHSIDTLHRGHGIARGLVVNSGNANAVTGTQGLQDANAMATTLDKAISTQKQATPQPVSESLVMSTGVIGQLLPIKRILPAINTSVSLLASSYEAWLGAATAFMTTDTFPKLRTHTFQLPESDDVFQVVGITKGAGMIHPDMAAPAALHGTLLGCLATDAPIEPASLQRALTHVVQRSFNSISVDGDTSTNDTLLAFANGAASSTITSRDPRHSSWISETSKPRQYTAFVDQLTSFAQSLASLVVRDGEGATKFIHIRVSEAPSFTFAHRVAAAVSRSPLVKCAIHGEDANWGRILCAIGYSGLGSSDGLLDREYPTYVIDPTLVNVSFVPTPPIDNGPELKLLVNGEPEQVDEVRAKELLSHEDVSIDIKLGIGTEEASYWTCDFSKEYISINADYRS